MLAYLRKIKHITNYRSNRIIYFHNNSRLFNNGYKANIKNDIFNKKQYQVMEVQSDGVKMDFDLMWLRDNCTCPKCWDPITLQRNFHHIEIDPELKIKNLSQKDQTIEVVWDKENHISEYSLSWLKYHYIKDDVSNYNLNKKLWNNETLGNGLEILPRIKYNEVMNAQGLNKVIISLKEYGIALVNETPVSSKATEALCEKIGPIRNTHYGGFWEFEADQSYNDAAYQNFKLEPHTDTTYFTDPTGLQIFHQLFFDGTGGEQIYMDGFLMAYNFKKEFPKEYELLAKFPIPFHSAGDEGQYLSTKYYTLFEHEVAGDITSPLLRIRYNYDSRSVPTHGTDALKMRSFYLALNKFIKTQHQNQKNRVYFKLELGTTIILDNYRVLHGRNAFIANKRKLCGAYINHDDLISKWNVLSHKDKQFSI